MKSTVAQQEARYGTLTLRARLGPYDVFSMDADDVERMYVVLPVRPKKPERLAKELRAIAKYLDGED